MSDLRTAVDWARTARFEGPVRLGDIEAELERRPLESPPEDRPWAGRLAMSLGFVLHGVLIGAPALGTLALVANPGFWGGAPVWSEGLSLQLYVAGYVVGILYAVAAVVMWVADRRRRSRQGLQLVSLLAVIAVLTCGLLLLPAFAEVRANALTPAVVLAALSLAGLLAMTLTSRLRSDDAAEHPLDGLDAHGKQLLHNRTEVLRILVQRGVLPRDVMSKAILAPLGTWSTLDDQ
ncbi:hypothetical protein [Microbacterium album]|uniref:Uncharacterized protein n=1 Tax=Microbacterium album TaxID=2053191 RepID=A0A917MLT2_9MICO|nr:hypothetical protein [Microbacterium album]GGH42837.1 hypothetical protein GCM10010921_16320 [Microbacterium album]